MTLEDCCQHAMESGIGTQESSLERYAAMTHFKEI